MKKSLFSLLGMTLLIGSVWAANGDLDISELFDGETPRVSDAYQRLLNDYDNARGYSTSPRVGCQDVNKIRVSSEPVEDLFLDDASQYILFISPYSMDRIKRGDSSIDYSKIIMKRKIIGNIPEGAVLDSFFFDIFSDEIDSKQKYYGFIVPVDSYDGVGRPSSEFELNMSECFGTISIANPDNPSEGITILDRNLGATSNDITSPDSYGYHYQWGNNYGFPQTDTIETTNVTAIRNDSYNHSGYYREEFYTSSLGYDYRSGGGDHYGLWGGENDSAVNNFGATQLNSNDRQGPCPDGYHVPSAGEWGLLIKYWRDTYVPDVDLRGNNGIYHFDYSASATVHPLFESYFKIPKAGYRSDYNATLNNRGTWGYYYSSSIAQAFPYIFETGEGGVISTDSRVKGYSVRCFKNTYDPVITLKPGLNSFSTPAVVDSISFSNGGDNISFAKMVNGKWTPVTFTDSNVKSVIRPLDGFIVRNSNSEDVTMTIVYDNDIDINDALPQKQLDAGWNFLGITKTNNPFGTIANAMASDIIDFTVGKTNKINLSNLRDATSFMLGKAYGVFVNNSNGIYGGRNNIVGGSECVGMEQANVRLPYGWSGDILTLYWDPIEGDVVQISIFDSNEENYKILGTVDMNEGMFSYRPQWNGMQRLKFTNRCGEYIYDVYLEHGSLSYSQELVDAYDWAYENGIISDPSIDDANMYGSLKNLELAEIMGNFAVNVLNQVPDTSKSCSFNDILSLSSSQKNNVTKACQLGLLPYDSTSFFPNQYTNQAEFGTILSKALWGDKYEGGIPYYANHLNALLSAGIINQISKNPENVKQIKGYVLLMLMRAAESRPAGILTNNITKAVVFPANEINRKTVFNGTYTVLREIDNEYGKLSSIRIRDYEHCEENCPISGKIQFCLLLNGEEYCGNQNNINTVRDTITFDEITLEENEPISLRIDAEYEGISGTGTKNFNMGIMDSNGFITDIAIDLAPVKIVDSSNELSVQAMSGKNTVLLNEPNAVLGRFMVMPTNSTQGYFDNLVLKVTNPAGSTLDYDDIELRIDGTEVDEGDWQSSDGRLGYEDLDKLVDSLGSEVEVSIKNPDDGDYVLDIIDINTVGTSHFGKDPIITFNKRFESALVYIESQRNEDDQTHYILGVDKYDDSDVIPSLRLFTGYDVEQNECVGSLSFDKLSGESFYFEDGDEIVINNGNDAQLIKCIEYIVAYDGQECVDLDENNNCNKYMPVMQIRSRVSINKDDYLDYFKIRTGGFRKVFGRDSVGNGVCGDGVIDAGENCSNCPVDLGDICNTNCNSVDDLQFSHSIDKNGLITLNWTPNRQVYIEVKDSSEADGDYGSDHGISEDKVNSPFVFDAGGHPNYYKFFAYDNYQQCDHYKRYVVDATNVCSGVDNLDIQHQIQNGKIILSWDSDVNLSIATVAPPLTLEMLESGQVTLTSETVENGTFSYDIDGSGDYIFILENNFWCDNERYYTVHVD